MGTKHYRQVYNNMIDESFIIKAFIWIQGTSASYEHETINVSYNSHLFNAQL